MIGSCTGKRSSSLNTGSRLLRTTFDLSAAWPGSLIETKASVEPYSSMWGRPSIR